MMNLSASTVAAALPYRQLIDTLDTAFSHAINVPPRVHHDIGVAENRSGTLLLMPAWSEQHIGVKIVTVFPGNANLGIPSVSGSYLLMDASTGSPVALLDGTELTLRRTAAASALASTYLSREDASSLLMIGTGNLAPHLIDAHASVRQLKEVFVWGRRKEAAEVLAKNLAGRPCAVTVVDDLEKAVSTADIISCATLSTNPLIEGAWLQPGQHVDLVGAFTATMAEADSKAMTRARVYVDGRAGAFSEAGEIVQALAAGALEKSDIIGSLRELATGDVSGRRDAAEITLFKSVGLALEDLAAAELAVQYVAGNSS